MQLWTLQHGAESQLCRQVMGANPCVKHRSLNPLSLSLIPIQTILTALF